MISLDVFLEDINKKQLSALNDVIEQSKTANISKQIKEFLKDCKHIKSQLGTGKHIPLSEINKNDKENDETQNVKKKEGGNGRQSRRPPLQIKSEDIFNVKAIKKQTVSDDEAPESSTSSMNVRESVKVKKEKDEMPAPTQPAPRKKKMKTEPPEQALRTTRSKAKKVEVEIKKEQIRKYSDVIIENTPVPIIDLVQDEATSESDLESTNTQKLIRKTRTKTKSAAVIEKAEETNTTRRTRTKTRAQQNAKRELDLTVSSQETCVREKNKTRSNSQEKKRIQSPLNCDYSQAEETNRTRSTRTKTRFQQNAKRERDLTESTQETPVQEKKKSRSNLSSQENKRIQSPLNNNSQVSVQTEYEDAVSTVENKANVAANNTCNANSTYVLSTDEQKIANETSTATGLLSNNSNNNNNNATAVVVQNPKVEELMTDDDSDIEIKNPRAKTGKNDVKTMFDPFEPSPVKKKVEAFEKLGAADRSSGIPVPNINLKSKRDINVVKSGTVKEKSKFYTPTTTSRFMPKVFSTSKINKALSGISGNESFLSGKTYSELKASQAEYREREKRREAEALKKKEELRKKREEAQIKAQEQREKEKQRFLEQQRLKEERTKQLIAEKEEKKHKLKEEQERKRLQAKEKAAAIKKLKEHEEALRFEEKNRAQLLEKQKTQVLKNNPEYMDTHAPLLPTADCYDSDDERRQKNVPIPSWCTYQTIKAIQIAMMTAGEACKNTFFCRQATTPDLQEIFGTMKLHRLKRTSSANWSKPPRYTLMPTIDQTEFDDDDDD